MDSVHAIVLDGNWMGDRHINNLHCEFVKLCFLFTENMNAAQII
jgi:hypothetical protein